MNERRVNWKAELSKQAQARAAQRQNLLIALEGVQEEIKSTSKDFAQYDKLKAQQREIIAQLAVL